MIDTSSWKIYSWLQGWAWLNWKIAFFTKKIITQSFYNWYLVARSAWNLLVFWSFTKIMQKTQANITLKNLIIPINTMGTSQCPPLLPLPMVPENRMKAMLMPVNAIGPSTNSKKQQEVGLSPTADNVGIDSIEFCKESGIVDAGQHFPLK